MVQNFIVGLLGYYTANGLNSEKQFNPDPIPPVLGEVAMIRINALSGMLRLEVAADSWFSKMNKREQQAYIRAHPHSKFAKMGGSSKPSARNSDKSPGGVRPQFNKKLHEYLSNGDGYASNVYKDRRRLNNDERLNHTIYGLTGSVVPSDITHQVYGKDQARANMHERLKEMSFLPGHDRIVKHALAGNDMAEKAYDVRKRHPNIDFHPSLSPWIKTKNPLSVGDPLPKKDKPSIMAADKEYKKLHAQRKKHVDAVESILRESLVPHFQARWPNH